MKRALAIAVIVTLAMAATSSVAAQTTATRTVWPDPPAAARIRFLRSLTPASAQRPPSLFGRLWRVVTGERTDAAMLQPHGIAVSRTGILYVADTFARAVHVYDLARSAYSRIPVDGDSLIGVAVTGNRLFVTDSARPQLLCLEAGRRRWALGRGAGLLRPTGIVAAGDRLHVVDTLAHRVVTVGLDGRVLGGFGRAGSEPGQFNFPTHIAEGADGRLYVSDSMNFRIQVFSAEGRFLSAFGRLGDGSGDFNRPKGVALDSDGHIYVVEGLFDAVQIFDADGRFLLAFGESGSGDGQLWLPTAISIYRDRIYVADSANGRVQEFEYLKADR